MDGDPAYGHIVVGVDGSPTSRAALRWAAREAELRRCALDVVYGWQVKGEPRPPGEWGGVAPPIEAYQQQARARTQGVVDEVLPNGARCELHVHAIHKPPGRALLSFCGTADLLVVGAKERGRLAGWLVGSTFDAALKNATCTVVVVRPPAQDAAAGDAAAGDAPAGDAAAGAAAVEAALAKGAPAKGAPAEGAPAEGAPAEGAPAEGAPAAGAPAEGAPAEAVPAEGAPAQDAQAEDDRVETRAARPPAEGMVAGNAPARVEGGVGRHDREEAGG